MLCGMVHYLVLLHIFLDLSWILGRLSERNDQIWGSRGYIYEEVENIYIPKNIYVK